MSWKHLKDENNYAYYFPEKPKRPAMPSRSAEDMRTRENWEAFEKRVNKYWKEKELYDEKIKEFNKLVDVRRREFHQDLMKEAGIQDWDEKIKNIVFNKVWERHSSDGLDYFVNLFFEEVEYIKNILKHLEQKGEKK